MGPRRYGKTAITLVDSVVPSSQNLDSLGSPEKSCAGGTAGANSQDGEGLNFDSSHIPAMDGFDFSSSTSAWKPDAQAFLAPGKHQGSQGGGGGASGAKVGRGGSPLKSMQRMGSQSQRMCCEQSSKEVPPVPQVSTAFISEHGHVRAKLDDFDFTLDGLGTAQSLDVRTSATLELVKLCRDADMRQLLRAHSLVHKVIATLGGMLADDATVLVLPAGD
jgi:hypothetical protein